MGSLGGGDTVSETCSWCGEGEVLRLSETVTVQSMVASQLPRFRQVPSLLWEGTAAHRDEREPAPGVCNRALSL
jgi:hypothetical protein